MSTPYNGLLEATSFVKNGGTNIQYLMANGSTLTQSANSGNSNFYLYNSNTTQNITPPSGSVTYNNSVQSLATIIYISHRTRDNIDIEVFFKQLSTTSDVYIQDQELSENFIQYNIIGVPIITIGAQIQIPVILRNSSGTGTTNFPNGHNILLSFFVNTLEIDTRLSNIENKTNQIVSADPLFGTTFLQTISVPDMRVNSIGNYAGDDTYITFNPLDIKLYASTLTYNNDPIVTSNYLGTITATGLISGSGFNVFERLPTEYLMADGSINTLTYGNITILQTKTQYQTALTGTNITGFNGNVLITSEMQSNTIRKTNGLSNEFLKANGSVDVNCYNHTQYLQILSPPTLINSNIETSLNGTGLTSNNMSMTWNDALNYSRNIYI